MIQGFYLKLIDEISSLLIKSFYMDSVQSTLRSGQCKGNVQSTEYFLHSQKLFRRNNVKSDRLKIDLVKAKEKAAE